MMNRFYISLFWKFIIRTNEVIIVSGSIAVILSLYTNAEFIPIDNTDIVNLEHVLPQNPSNIWNHISEEDRALYYRSIGNLALLTSPINTEAGNDGFDFKKQFYNQSEYILTQKIASYQTWNKESISNRQVELANLAVKTWPLK